MTDIDRNGPEAPAEADTRNRSGQDEEGSRPSTARRRATSDAMMQALVEDDMDRRPGVYRRLGAS